MRAGGVWPAKRQAPPYVYVLLLSLLPLIFCTKKSIRVDYEPYVSRDTVVDTVSSKVVKPAVEVNVPVVTRWTVYFDYDKAELRSDAVEVLRRCLGDIGGCEVVVEGHCDERGSEEYNLGLGERRSMAVRCWLVANGVRGDIAVVSYGKGKLVRVGCKDEGCHQENRRVEVRSK